MEKKDIIVKKKACPIYVLLTFSFAFKNHNVVILLHMKDYLIEDLDLLLKFRFHPNHQLQLLAIVKAGSVYAIKSPLIVQKRSLRFVSVRSESFIIGFC